MLALSSSDDAILCWDTQNSNLISCYKHLNTQQLSLLHNSLSIDQFLAQSSSLISLFTLRKNSSLSKSILSEQVTSMHASHSGKLLALGGKSGSCYMFDLSNGQLLRVWDAHFKSVTAIQFSCDDQLLFTGGFDSLATVYNVLEILDGSELSRISLSGHSLPVTGIHAGFSTTPRVLTCSLDKTIKIWDSLQGGVLLNIGTGVGVKCIAVAAAENLVYCGCLDGTILRIDITGVVARNQGNLSVSMDTPSDALTIFRGHSAEISAIQLTFDEGQLVSASKDGSCIVWDAKSGMQLQVFSQHAGPVHDIKLFLHPPHMQVSFSAAGKQHVQLSRYPAFQQSKLVSLPPVVPSNTGASTTTTGLLTNGKANAKHNVRGNEAQDEGVVQSLLKKINRLSKANDHLFDAIHDTI